MSSDDAQSYGMNLPAAMTIAAFIGINWVNTIELQVSIWSNFKSYSGLYFWAMLLASWGCPLHALGMMLFWFKLVKNVHGLSIIINISWIWMVTGFALVLFSRLHLILQNRRKLLCVLCMIIVNSVVLHIPVWIIAQIVYSSGPAAVPSLLRVHESYEKIQVSLFTLQEIIISGLYIWETRRVLINSLMLYNPSNRPESNNSRQRNNVMRNLIYINSLVICLDLAVVGIELANRYAVQTFFKAAVYSVKLRFEFIILNQLMKVVRGRTVAPAHELKGVSNGSGGNAYEPNPSSGKGAPLAKPEPYATKFSAPAKPAPTPRTEGGNGGSGGIFSGVVRTTKVVVDGRRMQHPSGAADGGLPLDGVYGRVKGRSARSTDPVRCNEQPSLSRSSSRIGFATKGA